MKELCSVKNTDTLYPESLQKYFLFFASVDHSPLIVSPDALWSKLRPGGLIFLFIFTEFFWGYPELP